MSKDFIKSGFGSSSLADAVKQEKQLGYFISSKLQSNYITEEYLAQWRLRKYETSDYFLNYIKGIFKDANFLKFFRYLRYPLPSAKIVQNKIIPDLKRVFWAENSLFRYDVNGIDTIEFLNDLKIHEFNDAVFYRLLFKHNSIIITDLDAEKPNSPFTSFIDIEDVVSIEVSNNEILRIAFKSELDGAIGYSYIDNERYSFYDGKYNLLKDVPHDLGETPAIFVSQRPFNDDGIVRQSFFSYIREELEEYVMLKTLQKMTDSNGAMPVTTYLKSAKKKENTEPNSEAMSAQKSSIRDEMPPDGEGILQPGTVIGVQQIIKNDGSLDMEVLRYYLNFHYIPVESLKHLNTRIKEVEKSIVTTLVGDVINSDEIAKNPEQIQKSISVLENTLRELSIDLGKIRRIRDRQFLSFKYGRDNVNEVTISYGSDFFLETETMLYDSFTKAPNPIERKNVLLKISQARYRDNTEQLNRQQLLYHLLPYSADKDFELAITANKVSDDVFEYQTRFNYWVEQFEAAYGDIVTYFNAFDNSSEEKYKQINNLILILINENK